MGPCEFDLETNSDLIRRNAVQVVCTVADADHVCELRPPIVLDVARLQDWCGQPRPALSKPAPRARTSGKFELYRDKAGKFRFRLKANNGEVILTSGAYQTKAAAKKGIASVRRNARPDAQVVEHPTAVSNYQAPKVGNGSLTSNETLQDSSTKP